MLKETSRLNRLCKFLPISKERGVSNVNGSEGAPHTTKAVSSLVTVHEAYVLTDQILGQIASTQLRKLRCGNARFSSIQFARLTHLDVKK